MPLLTVLAGTAHTRLLVSPSAELLTPSSGSVLTLTFTYLQAMRDEDNLSGTHSDKGQSRKKHWILRKEISNIGSSLDSLSERGV